jgi:hypothetical protein
MPTFTLTDSDGDELTIEADGVARALVSAVGDEAGSSVYVMAEEAPAVALALLESTGTASGAVSQAVTWLRSHLDRLAAEKRRQETLERAKALQEQKARLAREAAERERLEAEKDAQEEVDAEALRLLNAFRRSNGMGPISKAVCVPYIFGHWQAVARDVLNRTA